MRCDEQTKKKYFYFVYVFISRTLSQWSTILRWQTQTCFKVAQILLHFMMMILASRYYKVFKMLVLKYCTGSTKTWSNIGLSYHRKIYLSGPAFHYGAIHIQCNNETPSCLIYFLAATKLGEHREFLSSLTSVSPQWSPSAQWNTTTQPWLCGLCRQAIKGSSHIILDEWFYPLNYPFFSGKKSNWGQVLIHKNPSSCSFPIYFLSSFRSQGILWLRSGPQTTGTNVDTVSFAWNKYKSKQVSPWWWLRGVL